MMTKRYPIVFVLFNLGFLLLMFGLNKAFPLLEISNLIWLIYILFVFSTLGVHYFLKPNNQGNHELYVKKFMVVTTLKLMLYLLVIVFILLFNKSIAKLFIVWFLIHYFCFTAFETAMLYKKNKQKVN